MITLGIDPSLTGFGWCVHNPDVTGPARVIARGVVNTKADDIFVTRYMFLRTQLFHLIAGYPEIQAIGVESSIFGENFSEGAYALFVYVNEVLYLMRQDVVYFDPLTVKLLAKMDPKVIQGSMDKNNMIEAARAETDIRRWNNNEADAYLIGRSAARFWKLESGLITEEDLTPAEKHSFSRVHTYTKGLKAGREERKGLLFREGDRFFKFSKLPPSPIESEYVQWLLRSSPKNLELSQDQPPSPLQLQRPRLKPPPKPKLLPR
jgi:Holliday junction resolvasome RuvABC endonuclease subunit